MKSLRVSVVALVASVPLCEMIFGVNHGHLSPLTVYIICEHLCPSVDKKNTHGLRVKGSSFSTDFHRFSQIFSRDLVFEIDL